VCVCVNPRAQVRVSVLSIRQSRRADAPALVCSTPSVPSSMTTCTGAVQTTPSAEEEGGNPGKADDADRVQFKRAAFRRPKNASAYAMNTEVELPSSRCGEEERRQEIQKSWQTISQARRHERTTHAYSDRPNGWARTHTQARTTARTKSHTNRSKVITHTQAAGID